MRTLLAGLGLLGVLLTTIPADGYGGTSQARQVGWASWYGKPQQGRKTASGERFSRSQLTAAHRSLPLGTKVRVTNLRTGQDVVVKIHDRGPYGRSKRRIMDRSEGAAARISIGPREVERVRVVLLQDASQGTTPQAQLVTSIHPQPHPSSERGDQHGRGERVISQHPCPAPPGRVCPPCPA
jgi:rare lipoprotein A